MSQQGEVSTYICAVVWAADVTNTPTEEAPSAVEGSICQAMPQPRWCAQSH